jgi:hypothetical protein
MSQVCVICIDKPINHMVLPCAHISLCELCSNGVTSCPICRGDVTSIMKVYCAGIAENSASPNSTVSVVPKHTEPLKSEITKPEKVLPAKTEKTQTQLAEEVRWKRLGVCAYRLFAKKMMIYPTIRELPQPKDKIATMWQELPQELKLVYQREAMALLNS